MSLWGTSQSNARARGFDSFGGQLPDAKNPYRGYDVREGWLAVEGSWGLFIAGRQRALSMPAEALGNARQCVAEARADSQLHDRQRITEAC